MSTLTGQSRFGQLQKSSSSGEQNPLLDESSTCEVNYQTTSSKIVTDNSAPIQPLVYLYRGLMVQLIFMIPIGIWWLIGTKPLLLKLQQSEKMSTMTQDYLRILTPGLWSYSVNWTLTSWLQAIEMADVPAFASIVACILHIPITVLFVHVLRCGYLGIGYATVVTQSIQPIYQFVYLFTTKQGQQRVLKHVMATNRSTIPFWKEFKIATQSPAGIYQYLSLALPGIIIISEWWASEVSIFLSGTLIPNGALALGAMTIYQSMNTSCFVIPVGCSIAGSTRVSNFLGGGDERGAALAAKVCVFSGGLFSLTLACILFFTPRYIFPSLFTPDEFIIHEVSKLIPLLSIYVIGDGIQTSLNGIIKGCGRQCIVMPIVLIAYWLVGVPLAYYFSFILNEGTMCEDNFFCGVNGLVSGIAIGTWIHMLLLAFVVVFRINWSVEVIKAKERLENNAGHLLYIRSP